MAKTLEAGLARCAMFGMKPGLERMREVCAALGDPQDALKVVQDRKSVV